MTREEALALVHEYTKNQNLIKHMLAVEAAMRAYARKFGQDEESWGLAGLLHDFDYERYPNDEHHPTQGHPSVGVQISARARRLRRDLPSDLRARVVHGRPAHVAHGQGALRMR
jgi:putative nucleotidyltransferase with HDIG domain